MGLTVNWTSRGRKVEDSQYNYQTEAQRKKETAEIWDLWDSISLMYRCFWGPEERRGREWGKRNIWSSNAWNFLKIVGKHQLTGPRSSVNSKQNKCNKDHIWVHSIAKHTHMHKTKPNQKNLKSSQRGEMTLHLNKQ